MGDDETNMSLIPAVKRGGTKTSRFPNHGSVHPYSDGDQYVSPVNSSWMSPLCVCMLSIVAIGVVLTVVLCTLYGLGFIGGERIYIEARYGPTPPPTAVSMLVRDAIEIWRLYVYDMGIPARIPARAYCNDYVTIAEEIYTQGMVIYFLVQPIDGDGGVLGFAGPCSTDMFNFVRVGIVVLDIVDLDVYLDDPNGDDLVREILLHEIGHVLGIGTRWVEGETYLVPGSGNGYPYQKPGANKAHVDYGGAGPDALVEDSGGEGTAGGHWKEDVYENELMTGYVEGLGYHNIMSRVTLGALADLGYRINTKAPDYYVLPGTRRRLRDATRPKIYYHNDTQTKFDIIKI